MKIIHFYRVLTGIAFIIIFIAGGTAIYYFDLLLFPKQTISYTNTPFPVVTKTVHPGNTVIILMSYCKYVDIIPDPREYVLEDHSTLIQITTTVKQLPFGCHMNYLYDGYIIPVGTPPGIYHIHADLYYRENAISVYHAIYDTQKFYVR